MSETTSNFSYLRSVSSKLRSTEYAWMAGRKDTSTCQDDATVLVDIGSGQGAALRHIPFDHYEMVVFVEPDEGKAKELCRRMEERHPAVEFRMVQAPFPWTGWAEYLQNLCGTSGYDVAIHWALLQNHPKKYGPFVSLVGGSRSASVIMNNLLQPDLRTLVGNHTLPGCNQPKASIDLTDARKPGYHGKVQEFTFSSSKFLDPLRLMGRNVGVHSLQRVGYLNDLAPSASTSLVRSLRILRVVPRGELLQSDDAPYLRVGSLLPEEMVAYGPVAPAESLPSLPVSGEDHPLRDSDGIVVVRQILRGTESSSLNTYMKSLPKKREGKRMVFEAGVASYGAVTGSFPSFLLRTCLDVVRRIDGSDSPILNVRVSDYPSTEKRVGSGRHVDQFNLGSTVYCLNLGAPGTLVFFKEDGTEVRRISLEPGDAYSFAGVSRYCWEHEYNSRFGRRDLSQSRVALTIRTDSCPVLRDPDLSKNAFMFCDLRASPRCAGGHHSSSRSPWVCHRCERHSRPTMGLAPHCDVLESDDLVETHGEWLLFGGMEESKHPKKLLKPRRCPAL